MLQGPRCLPQTAPAGARRLGWGLKAASSGASCTVVAGRAGQLHRRGSVSKTPGREGRKEGGRESGTKEGGRGREAREVDPVISIAMPCTFVPLWHVCPYSDLKPTANQLGDSRGASHNQGLALSRYFSALCIQEQTVGQTQRPFNALHLKKSYPLGLETNLS